MPAPTNVSAGTAVAIGTLPASITQTVDAAGTTYTVWYKWLATFSGVVGVWGFGDLTTYKPGYTVYYNNGSTQLMNYNALPNNDATFPNRPFLMPVMAGITYYFQFTPNSGNPSPAVLTLSLIQGPSAPIVVGDFISNRETDDSYEHPMTIAVGSSSNEVRGFAQIAPPLPGVVTTVGLPHGDQGAILTDGHFLYIDEALGTGKVFDANVLTVKTITRYESPVPIQIQIGSNRTSSHFIVMSKVASTVTLDTFDTAGMLLSSKVLVGVSAFGPCCINNDGSILYFATTGSNSVLKSYVIATNVISTLATVTGFDIYDLLYLESGALLGIFLQTGASPPLQAKALIFDLTGSITHTYDFGSSWRSNFNPPRVGYALDSPSSFWVTLKPQAAFQTSELRNVKVSDGSTISTFNQTNYLFGQYIGSATATPDSRFGPEKSFALLVAPVSGTPTNVFVGTAQTVPIRWQRTLQAPVLDGNLRQAWRRLEVQLQPGEGVEDDPLTARVIQCRMSWDNGKTYQTEQLMSCGREGAYVTRAFLVGLGMGRWPVVELSGNDASKYVLTGLFAWIDGGLH